MGGAGRKEAHAGKGNTEHQGKEMKHNSGRKGERKGGWVECLQADLSPSLTIIAQIFSTPQPERSLKTNDMVPVL